MNTYIKTTHNEHEAEYLYKIFDHVMGRDNYFNQIKRALYHDHEGWEHNRYIFIFKVRADNEKIQRIRKLVEKAKLPNFKIEEGE